MDLDDALERSLAAVRGRRWRVALERLLVAWRADRSEGLASLIADVGEAAGAAASPEMSGRTMRLRQQRWLASAAEQRPEQLSPLLAELEGDNPRRMIVERVEQLARWPADPRVARELARLLEYESRLVNRTPLWQPLVALVRQHLDPAWGPALAPGHRQMPTWSAADLAALRSELAALPASGRGPDAEQVGRFGKALESLASSGADDLGAAWDRVYEAPQELGPRRVLADALLERGDPRGEFITLQLAADERRIDKAQRARMQELYDLHSFAWLGPLAEALQRSATFKRGFLDRARIYADARIRPVVDAREWRTLSEIDLGDCDRPHLLERMPDWPCLTAVKGVSMSDWEHLQQLELPGLTQLGLVSDGSNASQVAAWLRDHPTGRGVTSLTIDSGSWRHGGHPAAGACELLEVLDDRRKAKLSLRNIVWFLDLARQRDRWKATLRLSRSDGFPIAEHLQLIVGALPAERLATLEVKLPKQIIQGPSPAQIRELLQPLAGAGVAIGGF